MCWADWRLLQARRDPDGSVPRLAYLDGSIELLIPSRDHERIKSFLGRLVETFALETGVDLVPLGSWTLEAENEEAGAEPDECYQIGAEERERPDLAIEVIWTSGRLSKLEIYRRLGVPEVWIWRRGALRVFALRDGAYEELGASPLFPALDLQLLLELLDRPTVTAAQREMLARLRG